MVLSENVERDWIYGKDRWNYLLEFLHIRNYLRGHSSSLDQ